MDQTRFEDRRREFMDRIGDAIAVIAAGREQIRNHDVEHEFRQASDFFFLTGFPEPDAIAVFDPAHPTERYTLFVRPRDRETEAWNGRRAGVEGALERHGADAAHTIDRFDSWLRARLRDRRSLMYELGGPHDDRVLGAIRAARSHADRAGITVPDRIVDPGPTLHDMRLIKTPAEIDALRRACHISAVAHTEAMRYTAPGRTERQVQAAIEYVFASMGAERVGYGSIVAGGDSATILHYTENDRRLDAGDLLLIDAGAEYRHLTADITRTFPVDGRFTAPQRALYELVLEAERRVVDMVRPGLPYTDMHERAVEMLSGGMVDLGLLPGPVDDVIEKGWYRHFFFHGTGHWLGVDVHDAGPYRVDGRGRPLEPSMVFTVEPGIYVAPDRPTVELSNAPYDPDEMATISYELGAAGARAEMERRREEAGSVTFEVPREFLGVGIRIEDDILVTTDGYENLSAGAPVDPDTVEEVCAQDSPLPLFT